MSTRSERDKSKSFQEKHQQILTALLKDEDNKYCVDCDAKGPRWASWNLGIFLCIRCAGIHRNLGVHISKVKSVNLDSWTAEQIAMMQEMGNSRARAVYEANLQDGFRRPQTDSGLEAFIRAKYEQKKYIAKEWVPPQPRVPSNEQRVSERPKSRKYTEDDPKKEKKKARSKASSVQLPSSSVASPKRQEAKSESKPAPVKQPEPAKPSPSVDLLGLDTPAVVPPNNNSDPFGDFISSPVAAAPAPESQGPSEATTTNGTANSNPAQDLGDINLFGGENGVGGGSADQKKSKDSILALYGSGGSGGGMGAQQQMFSGAQGGGMYAGGQQMGGMMNGVMGQQQQQQPMMMGMQQQNMMQNQMWNGSMAGGMPQQQTGMMGNAQLGQSGMMMAGGGGGGMMAGGGMYNMPATGNQGMYNMPQQQQQQQPQQQQPQPQPQQQQQQQQFQQLPNQMAGLNMGGQKMAGGYPQMGGNQWGGQQQASGQTLSTNLWQ